MALWKRLREPSTWAGAVLAVLGGTGAVDAVPVHGLASAEFAEAFAIVVGGFLAILLKEKDERND